MKILVIDDENLIRKSFAHFLSSNGHIVTTAKDGSEANNLIEADMPDLIICDLLMPNIPGITFIQLLRNFHQHSVPVIIISTLDKGEVIAASLGLANIDFMAKPVLFEELLKKVNNYK